jgi:hypothetical protein
LEQRVLALEHISVAILVKLIGYVVRVYGVAVSVKVVFEFEKNFYLRLIRAACVCVVVFVVGRIDLGVFELVSDISEAML